jgi:chromatin assembly factor 1 subunit A
MSVEAPASPQKRPLPNDQMMVNTSTPKRPAGSIDNCDASIASPLTVLSVTPPKASGVVRQSSEAPSTTTSVSIDVDNPTPNAPANNGAPAAKRRKLSPSEKEQRKLEKEIKDKERAEQKAKKDEKRIKDEERRRKNEEKEVKLREKELEKQRKEEERLKKERVSQPNRAQP